MKIISENVLALILVTLILVACNSGKQTDSPATSTNYEVGSKITVTPIIAETSYPTNTQTSSSNGIWSTKTFRTDEFWPGFEADFDQTKWDLDTDFIAGVTALTLHEDRNCHLLATKPRGLSGGEITSKDYVSTGDIVFARTVYGTGQWQRITYCSNNGLNCSLCFELWSNENETCVQETQIVLETIRCASQ